METIANTTDRRTQAIFEIIKARFQLVPLDRDWLVDMEGRPMHSYATRERNIEDIRIFLQDAEIPFKLNTRYYADHLILIGNELVIHDISTYWHSISLIWKD